MVGSPFSGSQGPGIDDAKLRIGTNAVCDE